MLPRTLAFAFVVALLETASCNASGFYVSANGSGTACTAAAPCGYLYQALAAANVGDTIICLTPPVPYSVNITKSITIDCSGVRAQNQLGGVLDSDGTINSITINIGVNSNDPLRTVRLRGLTIDGSSSSVLFHPSGIYLDRGIEIQAAAAVYVEDCVISNVSQQGIYDHRTGGQTKLFVSNTVVSGAAGPGIVAASGAPGVMVLDNVKLLNNLYGLATASGNNVTLKNSTISGNIQAGVEADGGAQVTVENSTITNNNIGALVGGTVRLLRNNISFNNQAVSGSAISLGGNVYSGNSAIGTTPSLASGASGDVYN